MLLLVPRVNGHPPNARRTKRRRHRRPIHDWTTTEALIIATKILAATLFAWGASILFFLALS